MKNLFPFILAGSLAAIGFASAVVHPFGDVKGAASSQPLLSGSGADTAVISILEKSCQSCHSQKTEWPWYSYIAPASWLIENDVRNGRTHLNLSRWQEYSAAERKELLGAMGSAVRNRVMPLPRYLYLHRDAKLSNAEIETIYRWTKSERRRLGNAESPAFDVPTGGN